MSTFTGIYNVGKILSDSIFLERHIKDPIDLIPGRIVKIDEFKNRPAYLKGNKVFLSLPVNKSSEDLREILVIFTVNQWLDCGTKFDIDPNLNDHHPEALTASRLVHQIRNNLWVNYADLKTDAEDIVLKYGLTPDEMKLVMVGSGWRYNRTTEIGQHAYEGSINVYTASWDTVDFPVDSRETPANLHHLVGKLYETDTPMDILAFNPDIDAGVVHLVAERLIRSPVFKTLKIQDFWNVLVPYYLKIWRPYPEMKAYLDELAAIPETAEACILEIDKETKHVEMLHRNLKAGEPNKPSEAPYVYLIYVWASYLGRT
jgi:hypothetical protein